MKSREGAGPSPKSNKDRPKLECPFNVSKNLWEGTVYCVSIKRRSLKEKRGKIATFCLQLGKIPSRGPLLEKKRVQLQLSLCTPRTGTKLVPRPPLSPSILKKK